MLTKQDKDTTLPEIPASFVGLSGRFYVRQRRADGQGYLHILTVWQSVEAYNQRDQKGLTFCDVEQALADFDRIVSIYEETLTTTPPAYPREPDETDLGLTPARNFWQSRFTQARARHAA
jgi:hypothetical protein